MWKVPLFDLNFDERETKAVNSVLESKWLTSGQQTLSFEKKFSEYLGENTLCCAVANCTAALHMSLLVSGIKEGDEVIVSGLTFVAAVNAVSMVNARPVLADSISFDDWNVNPADIEKKITPRTKAIIVVHYGGYPCDIDEIIKIARKNKLLLIEDVAHAIGAEYNGKKCGTFGDIACFSFFSNKNLSTGEGGMFVTKDENMDRQARLLRSHGMTSLTVERHEGKIISYDVIRPGLNYRFDEIRAAIGIVQLEKLDASNRNRKSIVEQYCKELSGIRDMIIPWKRPSQNTLSSYHIFPVFLPKGINRNELIVKLKDKGIQTSIHYPAVGKFMHYSKMGLVPLPVADEISERVLTLPLYTNMTRENVRFVCRELSVTIASITISGHV